MGIIRDSFIIFKNWAEAINALPEEYQLETYKALVEYGTRGSIPDGISAVAHAMLVSFSVGMEKSICRYVSSVENGKRGGNPNFKKGQPNPYYSDKKQEEYEQKDNEKITKDNITITEDNQTLPNITNTLDPHNLNENVNVNVNVNVNEREKEEEKEKYNSLSAFSLTPLLEVLPGLIIDCEVKELDYGLLAKKVSESDFLKSWNRLSKFINNYEKIITDFYKDYEKQRDCIKKAKPKIIEHKYTAKEFKSMFYDIDKLSEE